MKVLYLGGNGFVGKNVLNQFSLEGINYLAPRSFELNLLNTLEVDRYIGVHKPDVVIFSAVNINSLNENMQMFLNVARCSHSFGKLISLGSGAEYDNRNYIQTMDESRFGLSIPCDTYGLSKYANAAFIENSAEKFFNLRVFGIYGKYEDFSRRFISNNICNVLTGGQISINQDMCFDYIYAIDFAKMLCKFLYADPAHKSYNVCATNTVKLSKLASIIRDTHDEDVQIIIKEEGLKKEYSGDNSRFICEFYDFNETKFTDGIAELYDWYKNDVDLSGFNGE